MNARFSKMEDSDLWEITKYNMKFDEQGKIFKLLNRIKNLVG